MTSGRLEDYHIGGAAADAQMRAAATPISFALVRVAEGAPSSGARGGTIDLEIIAEEAEIIRPKLDFNFAMTNAELEAATAAAAQSSLDADDVKDRLNASAREFVQWLYSGRAVISKNGAEARIGSVDGEAGSSLSIQLTGPRTGLWKDHATDDGGDLFTLYASYIGYDVRNDFVLVLQEIAKDFLGDKIEYERPKERPTPQAVIKAKKEKLGDKPRDEDSELLGVPSAIY